jgi:EAL domain-containing protein (putative c-di-GMP-specific phosphodiesterase class I)
VIDLERGVVAGYEALARFQSELAEPPNIWFERAALAGLSAELQALAIRRAREVASSRRLPVGSFLSINVSPGLLGDPYVRAALEGDVRALVIELTEEEAIADYGPLRTVMAEYRRRGARFAIDDAGAGYASMRHVTELRPDFVKLDARIVTGLAGDDGRQALVRAMQSFAHDIGAMLVAEGVETGQELALLADTGLPILVQGYAVARPGAPWPKVAPLAGARDEAAPSRVANRRPATRQQHQRLRPQRSDLR